MSKLSKSTLIFLGSGFSVEMGLPFVNQITERIKKHFSRTHFQPIFDKWVIEGFDGFTQESLNKLYEIVEVEEYNYEQIIGKLEPIRLA